MAAATLDMTPTTSAPSIVPANLDRLVLTGFMGSGKTTVGRLLAQRLGWSFIDLDHEIERRHGRSVPQIFAESGEAHFRRLEASVLASLLGQRQVILALGGGAPEELGNRLLLEQTPRTAVVYLSAPFGTLVERCDLQVGATFRPLLADREAAAKRFESRKRVYERVAKHNINTLDLDAGQTVEALLRALFAKK